MEIRNNYKTALTFTVLPVGMSFVLVLKLHLFDLALLQMIFFGVIALLSVIIPEFGEYVYNRLTILGKFLGEWISRIILFFVWSFAILPVGCLMKLTGRDRLRLKRKENTASYWIDNKSSDTNYGYQF